MSAPPHVGLPLTVEPTKPRLCIDARFVNFARLNSRAKRAHVSFIILLDKLGHLCAHRVCSLM